MTPPSRRAQVVGTGLIGGSVGLALRSQGWHVTGHDRDSATLARAVELGAIDAAGVDEAAELCFLAVPVGAIVTTAREMLAATAAVVTDVGSVKGAITAAIDDPRFVGGHPMAGSEQDGVEGSRATMFEGAVWVLTPAAATDPEAYAMVHSAVASMGAEVVTLDPAVHDRIVAMVSHVPHLTAATLMQMASGRATDQSALLRLAAGGFRDMTRIAAGHPGIWPDICAENRDAIVEVLDELIDALWTVRSSVDAADGAALSEMLGIARAARLNLPVTAGRAESMSEMRITLPDEPGQLAAVTALATDLTVNIFDIEIAHSAAGRRGVLIIVVDAARCDELRGALVERGYGVSVQPLS